MGVDYIILIILWNIVGFAIHLRFMADDLFCMVNPFNVYKYHKSLNWFGTLLVTLLYNIMCPVGTICYWFYKLCTVGRKN